MKPTGQRWHLRNDHQINGFVEFAQRKILEGKPITVAVHDDDRTTSQNSMFYGLYRDLPAVHEGLDSIKDARRYCKLHYGIPLLRAADPEFNDWYVSNVKSAMTYEAKLALMDYVAVTSEFNKKQGMEYITTILEEEGRLGHYIPVPDGHQNP